jgi:hypothetical protein
MKTIRWPGTPNEVRVRLARKVLKSGSRGALDDLFNLHGVFQMGGRWGGSNPLAEIDGALRVQALKALRGPPGKDHCHHVAAMDFLSSATKPSDLPFLTELLETSEARFGPFLFYAIDRALRDHDQLHPRLIAALEKRILHAPEDRDTHDPARTLGQYQVPEAVEALKRLSSQVQPWRRTYVLMALVWREPNQYRAEAEALLKQLEAEGEQNPQTARPYSLWCLRDALENLERSPDESEQTSSPTEVASLLERFDQAADSECTAVLERDERLVPKAMSALLDRLPKSSPARQEALLIFLTKRCGWEGYRFFHAVWPLTFSSDARLASLAIQACVATHSEQAIARLKTRLRKAEESGQREQALLIRQSIESGKNLD